MGLPFKAVVAQKLRTNFKDLGPMETDSAVDHKGRTLRQRLKEDVAQHRLKTGSVCWGMTYYDELRLTFGAKLDLHAALGSVTAMDGSAEPAGEVVKAMAMAQRLKPDRSLFLSFSQSCDRTLNLKEAVGLFRWMITLKVGCLKQLGVSKEALKFMCKTSLHTAFAAHWKLMLPWVDGVLHALLRKSRYAKQTDETFLKVNEALLVLLLDKAALTACTTAKDMALVVDPLAMLTQRWEVGRALFLPLQCKVMEQRVELHIRTAVESCFHTTDAEISMDIVNKARAKCMGELHHIEGIDDLPSRREVKIAYRSTTCLVSITALAEEVDLRFCSAIKGLAVEAQRLDKCFAEEILVTAATRARAHTVQIGADLVLEASAARMHLATL